MIYLDTSVLVSLYAPDANSALAAGVVQASNDPLLISMLCELEAVNALQLRVFRGQISSAQAEASISELALDLRNEVIQRRALPEKACEVAGSLSRRFTGKLGTRAADVLHVAAALELGASSFFSFDLQQRKLAEAAGLRLHPCP